MIYEDLVENICKFPEPLSDNWWPKVASLIKSYTDTSGDKSRVSSLLTLVELAANHKMIAKKIIDTPSDVLKNAFLEESEMDQDFSSWVVAYTDCGKMYDLQACKSPDSIIHQHAHWISQGFLTKTEKLQRLGVWPEWSCSGNVKRSCVCAKQNIYMQNISRR